MKKSPKIRTFNVMDIESPEFLKQLNIDELEALAESIRKFIIDNVSKTGGHLSSNLGTVEAIIAMHYVFDSPKDKFLFDVGHQCYTHKILTGRAKQFCNLRKKGGISGFESYLESEHDCLETGHSSTTISAACGFLEAKEINKEIGEVIAFIGDGSIQNGLAFEGLNYLGSQKNQKLILIVNDNEMSISQNVGRLAENFSKMRIKKGYNSLKRHTPMFIRRGLSRLVGSFRTFVYGRNIFTTMGYKYYGPIDGHNLKELIDYFKFAKNCDESVILQLNTTKGKGYSFAENDKDGKWHGVGPFNPETGEIYSNRKEGYISWSKGVSNILEEEIKKDERIRIISPATLVGTELYKIKQEYDNQIIDVGINEEHASIMAATMSRNGIIPIVSIYSTFFQRTYDYVVNDIDRSNNHVIFALDRSGLVGGDGSTHQGIFDISMVLPLVNFKIAMPSNLKEAKALFEYACFKQDSPMVIRYPKCDVLNDNEEFSVDKPIWLVKNTIRYTNILTYGDLVNQMSEIASKENVGLINALFIKPIDLDVLKCLNNTTLIVLEESIKNCNLASFVLEKVNELSLNIKVVSVCIDNYPDVATRDELIQEYHLDKDNIIELIKKYK